MKFLGIVFMMLIGLSSCNEKKVTVIGIITDIQYNHIGRNKYKQIISYSFSYQGSVYTGEKTNWVKGKESYVLGDSVKVSILTSAPEKSSIVGLLHPPKSVPVIKLEKKK
jgi:hypothetical protein